MDNNNNLTMLDILNILSFVIGIMNYNENLTQGDKQELMSAFDSKTSALLEEIHQHLKEQDDKLEYIIKEISNDR